MYLPDLMVFCRTCFPYVAPQQTFTVEKAQSSYSRQTIALPTRLLSFNLV